MTPARQPAASQRRNISVLSLAQALFMSVQGMGIAASPWLRTPCWPRTTNGSRPRQSSSCTSP